MAFGKKLVLGISFGAAFVGLFAAHALAQTEVATGPFTAAQIEDGRKAYVQRCAGCHLPTLAGQGDALPLAGRQFMAGWGNRTTQDLYHLIHASMPQSAPNTLDDQTYANLTAFILYANGAKPGPTNFLVAPPLRISLIANGIAPGDLVTTPAPAAPERSAAAAPSKGRRCASGARTRCGTPCRISPSLAAPKPGPSPC